MSDTDELAAGEAFRETMLARADVHDGPYPLWHGWVIMEAFLAGVRHARLGNAASPAPQSGEPVAWRQRPYDHGVWAFTDEERVAKHRQEHDWQVEPLYAAPPSSDVGEIVANEPGVTAPGAIWETNEKPPRRLTVKGRSGIDPDVLVAHLDGAKTGVWIIDDGIGMHPASVAGIEGDVRASPVEAGDYRPAKEKPDV